MLRRLFGIIVALALVAGMVFAIRLLKPKPENSSNTPTEAAPPPAVRRPTPAEARPRRPAKTATPTPDAAAAAPVPGPAPLAPETGTLHINSDVPGARVFLDREYIGVTPLDAPHIIPGPHTLNFSAQGYDAIVQTVNVAVGERDVYVRFKEVRLNAKIDVVHKHRFGSCRGELSATPQGLRFEADEGDDSFRVSLLELDRLDVDYLKTNLSVKVRKGREYNFTDPRGDADRLFVFHRDVAKARDRLARGNR